MSDNIFLTEKQVDELTGIQRGKTIGGIKLNKFALQVDFLRTRGIPFTENARGKPIIATSVIEGGRQAATTPPQAWQPTVTKTTRPQRSGWSSGLIGAH